MGTLNAGSDYHVWSQPLHGPLPRLSTVPFWPQPLVSVCHLVWLSAIFLGFPTCTERLGHFLPLNEFTFWRKVGHSAVPNRHSPVKGPHSPVLTFFWWAVDRHGLYIILSPFPAGGSFSAGDDTAGFHTLCFPFLRGHFIPSRMLHGESKTLAVSPT